MNRAAVIWVFVLILLPVPLLGYLDPGSGSMLFSAIIGIVATIFFLMKGTFFKIVDLPSYFRGVGKKEKHGNKIVFYSEGTQYWNVFLPIIKELSDRGINCSYLSSKENDLGLNCGFPNVTTKFIGEGNKAFFYLNTLSAEVCVMTTPGLDVLQIKRSKGVKKYIHITHSSGGCSGYSKYGVDYYDAVLTGGDGDKEFIEKIEEIRDLPKKEVEITGCTYLDVMREKLKTWNEMPEKMTDRKTVLVSPTWGNHGLLNNYGEQILEKLTNCGKFNVVIRPHPQSFVSEKEMIKKLMNSFPDSENIFWDREPDGLKSMYKSDIMVSDFSGIVFDFVFLFKKPVLSFKAGYNRLGKDSMDYPGEPWNIRSLDAAGRTMAEADVEKIEEIIEAVSASGLSENKITDLCNGMDKYPMESGKRGADFIVKTLNAISGKDKK